jgi:hypothetical protein
MTRNGGKLPAGEQIPYSCLGKRHIFKLKSRPHSHEFKDERTFFLIKTVNNANGPLKNNF